jgi:hypothetical protein
MLDFDLAQMYEVETRTLKQAVRRNIERFQRDFMFALTNEEWENLRSQFVISSSNWGGTRYNPYAFTEEGVAMLSSVLKSKKAANVNIAIMRAFVFVRQYALTHKELTEKLRQIEEKYDQQFEEVYEAINYLLKKDQLENEQKERKQIGYKNNKDF